MKKKINKEILFSIFKNIYPINLSKIEDVSKEELEKYIKDIVPLEGSIIYYQQNGEIKKMILEVSAFAPNPVVLYNKTGLASGEKTILKKYIKLCKQRTNIKYNIGKEIKLKKKNYVVEQIGYALVAIVFILILISKGCSCYFDNWS